MNRRIFTGSIISQRRHGLLPILAPQRNNCRMPKAPGKIELLPWHSTGSGKYRSLGMETPDYHPPSPERQKELKNIKKQEGY